MAREQRHAAALLPPETEQFPARPGGSTCGDPDARLTARHRDLGRLMVVDTGATPSAAAVSLAQPGIGLVVVCHGGGQAAGVLSKSDLIRHLAEPGAAATTVAALMSHAIISCAPDDDLRAVSERMARQGLQNVPVLGTGGEPLGVLDIRASPPAGFWPPIAMRSAASPRPSPA